MHVCVCVSVCVYMRVCMYVRVHVCGVWITSTLQIKILDMDQRVRKRDSKPVLTLAGAPTNWLTQSFPMEQ